MTNNKPESEAHRSENHSRSAPLRCRHFVNDNTVLVYLDLAGTVSFYTHSELPEQIERISQVISAIRGAIANAPKQIQEGLFVHMYADSIVIAQTKPDNNCVKILAELILKAQRQILIDSSFNEYKDSGGTTLMPTLTRAMIRKGPYYGMICSELKQSIEDISSNFSLVGGLAIVEMDKALKGLPMGTYIDTSLLSESGFEHDRLVNIIGESKLKFIKPPYEIYSKRRPPTFQSFEDWVNQLVQLSGNQQEFKDKLTSWAEAILNSQQIKRIKPDQPSCTCCSA